MKCVFICESGHTAVREKGDYRLCDYGEHWQCDGCGKIMYCWQELSETKPDNMSESMRAITSCQQLLDQALSEAESIWVDNKPNLRRGIAELKDSIRHSLDQISRSKEEIDTGCG